MKRILIIGNGFDISHGFDDINKNSCTKYIGFKNWLLKNIIQKNNNNFNENNIDLDNIFSDVSWISDAWVARNFFGLDNNTSDLYGKKENDNARYALASSLIWIFNRIEEETERNYAQNSFEDVLGHINKYLNKLIKETNIEEKRIFGSEIVERSFETINGLWREWISSIEIPENLQKTEYDKEVIKQITNDDVVVSFNYTETVELLFGNQINIFHIHGYRRNNKDILYVGHGNEDYKNDLYFYNGDYNIEDIIFEIEHNLLKPVDKIILEKENMFSCIENLIKDGCCDIYSIGFSFSNVDMKYIKRIIKNIDSNRITWHLSKYDEITDTKNGFKYRNMLLEIGFNVCYEKY